jgi:predicted polyphosphate/ATP-dependent NAD kinase
VPLRVGFVVNPTAGMGGKVGLKGTDAALEEALERGATPVAPGRAAQFLERLQELLAAAALDEAPAWFSAGAAMGEDALRAAGFAAEVVHRPGGSTSAQDTVAAVRAMAAQGLDLIVFVGGDGTARDVSGSAPSNVPLVGVPSGVKMHSAVFAVNPEAAADLLAAHAQGAARVVEAEVLDVDEEAYRRGEWVVKLYRLAPTLDEPLLRQLGKASFEELHEEALLEDIALTIEERAKEHPGRLWLLGPGGTVAACAQRLGVDKTLLGFDAWRNGAQVGKDLDERGLLALLAQAPDAHLLLSPIGAQGFILGRGNQQASPAVVRKVTLERLVLVATPGKVRATPLLRVDSGDPALDAEVRARGHLPVTLGYRTSRLLPVAQA